MINSYMQRKKIVYTAVTLIVLTAVFFLFIPIAHAFSLDDILVRIMDFMLTGLKLFSEVIGNQAARMYAILGKNTSWDRIFSGEGYIGNAMSVVTAVAAGLFFVYLLIMVIQEALEKGEISFDAFVKIALKGMVALLLIIYSPLWTEYLGKFCVLICGFISKAIDKVENPLQASLNTFYYHFQLLSTQDKIIMMRNAFPSFTAIFTALLFAFLGSFVVALIVDLALLFITYGLLVEVALRKIFTPLAMTGIMTNGQRSPGAMYIKKFVAAHLRIIIYMVAITVGDFVALNSLASCFDLSLSGLADTMSPDILSQLSGGLQTIAGDAATMFQGVIVFPLEYTIISIAAIVGAGKCVKIFDEVLGVTS